MNAVTWGVFKGREVIQPTVVDPQAFVIWKDEALKSFVETWAAIYKAKKDKQGNETGGDDESIEYLKACRDTFYLVNIVDNNFIDGDLNKIMLDFVNSNKEFTRSCQADW